ncbi:High-affinity nitrate transporter 3.1 [Acorus calamus]|uniref:High-affinity nitrate transporter n=1 Tax=Acorus calamus TaxID=4465 RepID=A0AAV9D1W8_ACOCL|nr:High-affinity nitrate transporter 3.1 [Acorus calamus]
MGSPSLILTALSLLLCCSSAVAEGVLFSSLKPTLSVTASFKKGQALVAGEDTITVSWSLNQTLAGNTDASYKTVKVKLCYAPVSQTDRGWRKTKDDLKKDKTCQFTITTGPYPAKAPKSGGPFTWTVERDIPTATYFVRAYAFDASEKEVAYGQTTDAKKSTNLFEVKGITGRHASIDIAAACFSAFSVVSLAGFFVAEKRRRTSSK